MEWRLVTKRWVRPLQNSKDKAHWVKLEANIGRGEILRGILKYIKSHTPSTEGHFCCVITRVHWLTIQQLCIKDWEAKLPDSVNLSLNPDCSPPESRCFLEWKTDKLFLQSRNFDPNPTTEVLGGSPRTKWMYFFSPGFSILISKNQALTLSASLVQSRHLKEE